MRQGRAKRDGTKVKRPGMERVVDPTTGKKEVRRDTGRRRRMREGEGWRKQRRGSEGSSLSKIKGSSKGTMKSRRVKSANIGMKRRACMMPSSLAKKVRTIVRKGTATLGRSKDGRREEETKDMLLRKKGVTTLERSKGGRRRRRKRKNMDMKGTGLLAFSHTRRRMRMNMRSGRRVLRERGSLEKHRMMKSRAMLMLSLLPQSPTNHRQHPNHFQHLKPLLRPQSGFKRQLFQHQHQHQHQQHQQQHLLRFRSISMRLMESSSSSVRLRKMTRPSGRGSMSGSGEPETLNHLPTVCSSSSSSITLQTLDPKFHVNVNGAINLSKTLNPKPSIPCQWCN
jgi:hypothetical protein